MLGGFSVQNNEPGIERNELMIDAFIQKDAVLTRNTAFQPHIIPAMKHSSTSHTSSFSRRQWLQRAGLSASAFLVGPGVLHEMAAADTPKLEVNDPKGAVVRLSSNENPYGPSPSARQAVAAAMDEACRYPYSGAWNDLKQQIAEKEEVTTDHVVIGTGSGEILAMSGMAYGMDSGEVIAADPTYQGLLRYAEHVGGYVHRVPVNDDLGHDLEAMERRITQAAKMMFICNPNNPTGTLLNPDKLRAFCMSVSKRVVVFMDEAYIELIDNPEKNTMVDLVREGHNIIVSRTFSKIHGLAGMRIGYAIARPDIAKRISTFRMTTPNVLGLRAAAASHKDYDFQETSRRRIEEGRQMVYNLFEELNYTYIPSFGSFVFFHTGLPIQAFQKEMLQRNVLVGRPFPPYLDWCRVSIGSKEDMAQFVRAFRDFHTSKA